MAKFENDKHHERDPVALAADLRQIVDMIPAFVWGASADGSIEFLNQRGLAYTGFSMEQLRGWNWKDSTILHPDDAQRLLEAWQAIVASGQEGEIQARMRRFDGEYKWFLFRVAPLRDHSGELLAWFGVDIEIDERKRAEDELRRSQSYLAEAQRLSRTGSFGWKPGTNELIWSAETFCILGYDADTKPTLELALQRVHPEDLAMVQQTLARASSDRTDMDLEHRLLFPDGIVKYVHVIARPVTDAAGSLEFVGAVSDVTPAKLAEENLRRSEAYLAEGQRLTRTGSYAWNATTRELTYWSEEIYRLWGFDPKDGMPKFEVFRERIHPDDRAAAAEVLEKTIREGVDNEILFRILLPDGTLKYVHSVGHPVFNTAGEVVEVIGTNMDVTAARQAQMALQKAYEEIRELKDQLQKENIALREEIDKSAMFEEIVGSSEPLRAVLAQVSRVAPSDSTVLILGETGTGKELVARAIHKRSRRAERAFIRVNCAAIPQSLIASELFGHEKGAFTGALQRRIGRFESAQGGTIFLDEVGDLPAETQVALLRVLQEREIERVGGNQPISVDVRVLAATNRDLKAAVAAGTFRQDLFYRLNVFPIQMPSLRERADDIPILVEYLIERYGNKAGKRFASISKKTMELFQAYDWPGNVRELQNVIERAVLLCDDQTFSVDESWLTLEPATRAEKAIPLASTVADRERELIEAALMESNGRVSGPSGAAAKLGIPRQTLEFKIKSLGINKYKFKTTEAS